jgi:hypothetical protein
VHTNISFTRFLVYSRSTRPRKSVCQRTCPLVLSKYPIYASTDASYRDNGCILPRGCCAAPPSVPNGYVSRHISVERITFIFVCFSLLLSLPLSLSHTHSHSLTPYSLPRTHCSHPSTTAYTRSNGVRETHRRRSPSAAAVSCILPDWEQ